MLAAAEAQIDQSAEDDKERARNRAKLYAPPKGWLAPGGRRSRPGAMTTAQAQALMQQLAAEDARVTGMRSS
ncbi:hypothetical protein GCM10010387_15420 [Streptomyces inusitatus]|uniref:Uncharacterized protein n=1 Tax=Streptomyces inusitatus TaxID=68221 RepID=A0A918PUJ0_9ACTN|nr:hypothetical protein [Streptomyces inusitatus]GGZ23227.1 hypothetical protein GCM10010387_15420 [Streptomyces inusitatus]